MLRQSAVRMARLDTLNLYHQMDPNPTRGWRNHFAEKLRPDETQAKAELHKKAVYEFGEDYGKVTENNFPYPLFWAAMLWIPMCVLACYPDLSSPGSEAPQHTWNPKNADGSTQFPLEPVNPIAIFKVDIKEA